MSIESVAKALRVTGLSPSQKLVLIGLANHDGDGGCWPGIVTLCEYTDLRERQVQYILRQLASKGLVEIVRNAGGNAGMRADRRPNLYVLHLDGVQSAAPGATATGCSPASPRGAVATAPEPSSEPSTTTSSRQSTITRAVRSDDDDWMIQVEMVLAIIVAAKERRAKPRSPIPWRKTTLDNARSELGIQIRHLLHSGRTPLEAAGDVLGSHSQALLAAGVIGVVA